MKDLSVLVIDQVRNCPSSNKSTGLFYIPVTNLMYLRTGHYCWSYRLQHSKCSDNSWWRPQTTAEGTCSVLQTFLTLSCFLYLFLWLLQFDAGIAGGENTKERGDGNVCYSTCYYVLCHVSPPNPEGDNLLIPKPNCLYEPFTYHMLLLTLPAGNPFALWDYGVAGYALLEESGSFELPLLQIRDDGALFVSLYFPFTFFFWGWGMELIGEIV